MLLVNASELFNILLSIRPLSYTRKRRRSAYKELVRISSALVASEAPVPATVNVLPIVPTVPTASRPWLSSHIRLESSSSVVEGLPGVPPKKAIFVAVPETPPPPPCGPEKNVVILAIV
jgi:hypothetical protein